MKLTDVIRRPLITEKTSIQREDGRTIVFIEVKSREGRDFGDAAEAVTPWKRRRMARVALDYLVRHHLDGSPCRFNVVSVHLEKDDPVVLVFQNAFDAA